MATFKKTLWTSQKAEFIKRVEHLNKILAKYDHAPYAYAFENVRTEWKEFVTHYKGESSLSDEYEQRLVEVCDVTITGETVVKRDDKEFRYIGSVTFEDGLKSIAVKDEAFKDYFTDKFRDGYCDHCRTTRHNRKSYYLFESGGEVVQIGSTCAREYFGIPSTAFLSLQEPLFTLVNTDPDDFEGAYNSGCGCVEFSEVYKALDIATKGFRSWVKASSWYDPMYTPIQEWPTVRAVERIVFMSPEQRVKFPFSSANKGLVTIDEVRDYWRKNDDDSSFAYNVRTAVDAGYANKRLISALAWGVFKVVADKVKAAGNPFLQDLKPCPFAVGERVTVKGVVMSARTFESEECYDGWHYHVVTKTAINFKADGTLYSCVTSSGTFDEVKDGDTIEVRGTVADGREYKGVTYTGLKRPKCQGVTHAAAPAADPTAA